MPTKVTFFGKKRASGETGEGRTSLIMRNTEKRFRERYTPTIGVELYTSFDPDDKSPEMGCGKLQVWDLGGDPRFMNSTDSYLRGMEIFVYCVDSTVQLNEDEIKADLKALKEKFNAPILLVGTKCDLKNLEFEEALQRIAKESNCYKSFITSAKNNVGVDELFKELHLISNPMKRAIQQAGQRSLLGEALGKFQKAIDQLPGDIRKDLGKEALSFVTAYHYQSEKSPDKKQVIDDFASRCEKHLQKLPPPEKRSVLKAISAVVIAAVVTFIAAAVGFGIGFAAGLWTGPGAFISGIMAGGAAASAVAGTSAALGASTGAVAASSGLFKPKETEASSVRESIVNIREVTTPNAKKS